MIWKTQPPPPPRRQPTKGEPPERVETRNNLAKPEPTGAVALNLRVPTEFKRDVKGAAATHGVTQPANPDYASGSAGVA